MNTLQVGDITFVGPDPVVDHYAIVLADLRAQRERIDIAISAIMDLKGTTHTGVGPLHIIGIDDEGAPPSGPPPKPFASRIEIPTDPEALKAQANALLERGMSVGEVERELNLTPEQATAFFRGR